MSSSFDFGNADQLFEKILNDDTGRLRKLVNQIVQGVRAATDMGCEPDELQMLLMVGYMSSKEPETRQLFDMLLQQTVPKDDDFH